MTRSQKEAIDNRDNKAAALTQPATEVIREALQALLNNFKLTPAGPLQMQPATRQLFKLTPSPSGLTLSILGFTALPVTVEVKWKVFRNVGNTQKDLPEGTGFDAAPNLDTNPAETGILFFPQIAEDITGAESTAKFAIRVSVKGTVQVPVTGETITAGPVNLPDVPVTLPVLLVPTILAFFRHKNFQAAEGKKPGFVLLTVPTNSALGQLQNVSSLIGSQGKLTLLESQVTTLVNSLNAAASQVQSLAALASNLTVFLTGLRKLKSALANPQMAVGVCPRGASDNLNTITMIDRDFFIPGDVEGENEISSIIALGVTGQVIKCYNKRHFEVERGVLGITTGTQLCAVINDLEVASPVSSIGNAQVRVLKPPKVALRKNTFDNVFSSFHFGNNPPRR